ncbi:hypothetical protein EZS27_011702 [termite gut metagenome]|uniref:DUF4160 domain-containing protein n=1 Tax=termite gut metagenome TaxID=433724 RepID=A0A5J4S3W9_9ZZZZ
MSEICRFFGIIIVMFADDHNPPHFHIKYGDYQAVFTIDRGIIKGEIPIKVAKMVSIWVDLHREELLANWENLQNGTKANAIEPLKNI